MIKAKPWNGKDLKGTWEVTLKIDGVRALWTMDGWVSRANKPLYNIPHPQLLNVDCEVYLGNFKDTIRAVRTQTLKQDTPRILPEHLFSLDPLDDRLEFGKRISGFGASTMVDPSARHIRECLGLVLDAGYEGLVLRQGDKWLKVKPEETHDVLVTGAIEGTGKHKGRLGALITGKGKVGTGFSDDERETLWAKHTACIAWWQEHIASGGKSPRAGTAPEPVIGQTIEVSCMHFTPDGMFRHPRFVRLRPDKVADE